MAKIKNTGGQPRGFNTEEGGHIVVPPGGEAEFNMSEADFDHLKKLMDDLDDPKPFELSGSHGGVSAKKKEKKEGEEMPAQSTEPPPSQAHQEQMVAAPMTDKERREQSKQAPKHEEERAPQRGR